MHSAQLMPLPLTVSRFSKIQIGFTFLVPAYPGSPGERSVKRVCVCVCVVQELVLVIWFGTEFFIRIWSAGYRSRYRQIAGRLRFIRRPLCIVGTLTSAHFLSNKSLRFYHDIGGEICDEDLFCEPREARVFQQQFQ